MMGRETETRRRSKNAMKQKIGVRNTNMIV